MIKLKHKTSLKFIFSLICVFQNLAKSEELISTVIGIDLGTTYSCVAVYKNGHVDIIPNDQGNRITPSYSAFNHQICVSHFFFIKPTILSSLYVAFTGPSNKQRLLGDAAKNQLSSNPKNTIFDVKRIIGRLYNEHSVQADLKHFPFEVIAGEHGQPLMKIDNGDTFSPEEISAMVLTKMKETAEDYLSESITNAVVTVPAYFNDAQRAATKIAGTIAGLNILRIINEPTAAAIAYGLDSVDPKQGNNDIVPEEKIVLVFDLGGGTFDVSLLSIENGVFEVMATSGDTHLGGEDFDQRVMQYLMKVYKKKTGHDVRKEKRTVQKLRREVEKAKRALSNVHSTKIEIESFYKGKDFTHTLTRAKFEELNMDLFKNTIIPMKKVLSDAKIGKSDVDDIVLVGGSTRIPRVQKLVQEFFDNRELSKGLNPDEAIAYGAAVQGAVLSGKSDQPNIVLIDVCPLSMGIETKGGVMNVIVERNSAIPVKKTKQFTTVNDQQEMVTFKVYEGERSMAKDNHLLGQFDLTGIQPEKRGIPQLIVTFELDTNGLLKVSAEDEASSSKEEITIQNDSNRLSAEEIQEMLENSKKYAEEDKKAKEYRAFGN